MCTWWAPTTRLTSTGRRTTSGRTSTSLPSWSRWMNLGRGTSYVHTVETATQPADLDTSTSCAQRGTSAHRHPWTNRPVHLWQSQPSSHHFEPRLWPDIDLRTPQLKLTFAHQFVFTWDNLEQSTSPHPHVLSSHDEHREVERMRLHQHRRHWAGHRLQHIYADHQHHALQRSNHHHQVQRWHRGDRLTIRVYIETSMSQSASTSLTSDEPQQPRYLCWVHSQKVHLDLNIWVWACRMAHPWHTLFLGRLLLRGGVKTSARSNLPGLCLLHHRHIWHPMGLKWKASGPCASGHRWWLRLQPWRMTSGTRNIGIRMAQRHAYLSDTSAATSFYISFHRSSTGTCPVLKIYGCLIDCRSCVWSRLQVALIKWYAVIRTSRQLGMALKSLALRQASGGRFMFLDATTRTPSAWQCHTLLSGRLRPWISVCNCINSTVYL